ncbi:hypothetical protein SESBI_28646 [Sesbania bispinosa]|nr:hypothetical protein SESBI_28646 [Sesbania bispinosa]
MEVAIHEGITAAFVSVDGVTHRGAARRRRTLKSNSERGSHREAMAAVKGMEGRDRPKGRGSRPFFFFCLFMP